MNQQVMTFPDDYTCGTCGNALDRDGRCASCQSSRVVLGCDCARADRRTNIDILAHHPTCAYRRKKAAHDVHDQHVTKYQKHSPTSRQAAREIEKKAPTARARVYHYLLRHGPAIDEEIQRALDMSANTQRPRRVELVERDLVRDSGRTKKTATGRAAVLWEAVGTTEASDI